MSTHPEERKLAAVMFTDMRSAFAEKFPMTVIGLNVLRLLIATTPVPGEF
jgi:hypothetical protein